MKSLTTAKAIQLHISASACESWSAQSWLVDVKSSPSPSPFIFARHLLKAMLSDTNKPFCDSLAYSIVISHKGTHNKCKFMWLFSCNRRRSIIRYTNCVILLLTKWHTCGNKKNRSFHSMWGSRYYSVEYTVIVSHFSIVAHLVTVIAQSVKWRW